jgi:glycosyltransferase involved in cell wall biosynthesis
VSEATRRDVLEHQLLPPERVVTIPNGVHPACTPLPQPEADAAAMAMLGATDATPLVVHVGSTIARKRIDVLLRVFAGVRERWPLARLVRVGSAFTAEQERLRDELELGPAIIHVPFVTHDVLAAIYRQAWVVLVTSDAEGFGLPLVEAGACGAPVIASDIAVLREVGGSAVAYQPVAAIEAWVQAVSDILTERRESPAVRAGRRDAAIANAARFSWSLNAARTVELYRDVLSR